MLRKLIKHEFRATGRIMLPLFAAIIVLSVMAGFSTRILDNPDSIPLFNAIGIFILCAYFAALSSVGIVALVIMLQRFEKNLLGDEGYLMFTLPVSVDKHIFSKLIVSVVWFACVALISLSMLLMIFSADTQAIGSIMRGFEGLGEVLGRGFARLGGGSTAAGIAHTVGYVLELIIGAVVFTAEICLRFSSALAIGYSFKNHKKLLSVITFFAMIILLNTVGGAIMSLAERFVLDPYWSTFRDWAVTSAGMSLSVHIAFIGMILYGLLLCLIFYLPTKYFLKNRLNLA